MHELHRSGFNPLRVGHDSWEARCPVHKGTDRSLAVGRNELNHVMLECRSTEHCQYSRIVGALGLTNDHVYAETPDWLIRRLSGVPIRPASFKSSNGNGIDDAGISATEGTNGSTGILPLHDGEPSSDRQRTDMGLHAVDDRVANVVSAGPTSSAAVVESNGSSDPSSPSHAVPCDPPGSPGTDPSANADIRDNVEPERSLQVLMRVASGARFFRSTDGRLFSQVPVGTRHEIYGLKSTAFRDWLIEGHFADCGEIPSQWTIRRVLTALEARERFGEGTPAVFIRVGHDGTGSASPFFIDLGDSSGRAISNDDRSVIHVQRPVLLSGIEEFVRRSDLSDRCVTLNLSPIDDHNRRREDEFWPAFHQDQPKILGGLLDAIAGGLRELPSIKLAKLPRMADFAAFGEAVGRTLRWPDGTFIADYDDSRRESTATHLEDSIVATVLLRHSHRIDGWSGTASELLSMLSNAVGGRSAASAHWPKSPARLTNELRRIAPQLRMHGLTITFERKSESRLIALACTSTLDEGYQP